MTPVSFTMSASPDVTTYGRTLRIPQRPDCRAAGRFSSASEVGMLTPTELGRRITSAQDRLRAARRDGRFDDIVIWRDELDALLKQWPRDAKTGS